MKLYTLEVVLEGYNMFATVLEYNLGLDNLKEHRLDNKDKYRKPPKIEGANVILYFYNDDDDLMDNYGIEVLQKFYYYAKDNNHATYLSNKILDKVELLNELRSYAQYVN